MPVAIVKSKTEKFELKSLEGAYVEVRRMTYGEKLQRSQMVSKIAAKMDKSKDTVFDIEMLSEQTTLWEFANLIVDHNLTDEHNRMLNFKDYKNTKLLDPIVGEEISNCINKINSFEDDEDLKN